MWTSTLNAVDGWICNRWIRIDDYSFYYNEKKTLIIFEKLKNSHTMSIRPSIISWYSPRLCFQRDHLSCPTAQLYDISFIWQIWANTELATWWFSPFTHSVKLAKRIIVVISALSHSESRLRTNASWRKTYLLYFGLSNNDIHMCRSLKHRPNTS